MNKILLSLLATTLLPGALGAAAIKTEPTIEQVRKDEPATWYTEAAAATTYANATARDPLFADTKVWSDDARKAAYAKQNWPKARGMVWAKPGVSAKDGWDVSHWLEDGKPAVKPFDENTDLILPASPKGGYDVSLTDGRKYQPARFRHLTIERGAHVVGHFAVSWNVWIKSGGSVSYLDSVLGTGHTFLRNDNLIDRQQRRSLSLVDHFFVRKAPGSSVKFVGLFRSEDNWQVESGMMVLAPQSEIGLGNRTPTVIGKDAAIAILSDAYLSRRTNCDWSTDLTVKGKLLGGLPERPLTSDARLGIGWKSKGSVLGTKGGGRNAGPNDYGMIVNEGGSITVTTSNPAKARLVINCSKRDDDWGQIEIISRDHPLHGDPAIAKLKELPRLTDMIIKGDVTWKGILLDDFKAGGIQVETLPDLNGNGPAFGTGNADKPQALFTVIPK